MRHKTLLLCAFLFLSACATPASAMPSNPPDVPAITACCGQYGEQVQEDHVSNPDHRIVAVFNLLSVDQPDPAGGDDQDLEVRFFAVTDPDQFPDAEAFTHFTPSGALQMTVKDVVAAKLQLGEAYKVTIEPFDPALDAALTTVIDGFEKRNAEAEPILRFFAWQHLPEHLQAVSKGYSDLAHHTVGTLPRSAERSTALRKLLEGKDAAVRAAMPAPTAT